jgi:hypothetical protein
MVRLPALPIGDHRTRTRPSGPDVCAIGFGGLNLPAVGKTAIATSGRPEPFASPARTSLVLVPAP